MLFSPWQFRELSMRAWPEPWDSSPSQLLLKKPKIPEKVCGLCGRWGNLASAAFPWCSMPEAAGCSGVCGHCGGAQQCRISSLQDPLHVELRGSHLPPHSSPSGKSSLWVSLATAVSCGWQKAHDTVATEGKTSIPKQPLLHMFLYI